MVYIDTRKAAQAVYLPANGWAYGLMWLRLAVRNTTDGREVVLPHTEARRVGFMILLTLGDLPAEFGPGEWQYSLTSGETTIATGLLAASAGQDAPAVEYTQEKKVIQYGG